MISTRLTERARRAIGLAGREARAQDARRLGTEHLLLGLLAEERDSDHAHRGTGLLTATGLDLDAARRVVARVADRSPDVTAGPADPALLSPEAAHAVDRAGAMSDELLDFTIGVRHVLAALLEEQDGPAARVLRDLGVDPRALGSRVQATAEYDDSPRPSAGLDPVFQQLDVVLQVLGRISGRLDAIEARLPGTGPGPPARPGPARSG